MKRTRITGLIDVIKLDSLDDIREMTQSPSIDRRFDSRGPIFNGVLIRHLLGILSFRGRRFPTMTARDAPHRAAAQDRLWVELNGKAGALREGVVELEELARWVKGSGDENELGRLVQQAVGRQFDASYVATEETWKAALTLGAALRIRDPFRILSWWITGKTLKAKRLLASKVGDDLAGIHGTGVALHNIVKAIERMRDLYINVGLRTLASDEVISQCLFAPASVLRQATGAGTLGGCPFAKGSLFVVALSEAQKVPGSQELVFMDKTWNRCPAEQWVPALLAGVWKRASTVS